MNRTNEKLVCMEQDDSSIEIPTEIIQDILLRLSVKTLMRFKSVCKNWRGIIESQYFIERHFEHERNQECLLFQFCTYKKWGLVYAMHADNEDERSPTTADLCMPNCDGVVALVGPVKGVFCAVNRFGGVGLSNPAMHEFRPLPPLPLHDHPSHPLVWSFEFGFGFCGDFKIVAFLRDGNFGCVYSLSSDDSWRIIEGVDSSKAKLRGSACFNGSVLYWLVDLVEERDAAVLAFDMRSEKFEETLPLPNCLRFPTEREVALAASGDSLVILSYEHRSRECVDLWVMEKQGVWSKRLSVGPFQEMAVKRPVCVWKRNEVVLDMHTCMISGFLQKKVGPNLNSNNCLCCAFSYKESLVSVQHPNTPHCRLQDFFVSEDKGHWHPDDEEVVWS